MKNVFKNLKSVGEISNKWRNDLLGTKVILLIIIVEYITMN